MKVPKQAEAKRDGVVNLQNYNCNQFWHGKCFSLYTLYMLLHLNIVLYAIWNCQQNNKKKHGKCWCSQKATNQPNSIVQVSSDILRAVPITDTDNERNAITSIELLIIRYTPAFDSSAVGFESSSFKPATFRSYTYAVPPWINPWGGGTTRSW